MATPVHAPRINNNEDEVKVLQFDVAAGAAVKNGQIIAQVETDKAALDVTAPCDGFVLGFVAETEAVVKVGSILMWLGASADEPIPQAAAEEPAASPAAGPQTISAKAKLLLRQHGLKAEDVTPIDGRITVEAIERHLAGQGTTSPAPAAQGMPAKAQEAMPTVAGASVNLTGEEKGMAATVAWHRDYPVTGYIEIDYDLAPWAEYAKTFQESNGLLLSPLLSLMAWRLVGLAKANPKLNATMAAGKRYEYAPVNLGFTIQAGDALYLATVRDAANLDEPGFVNALGDLQRRAAGHNLKESEATGATIGFSSMERWKVTRHVPILSPHTSIMIAHAAGRNGTGTLGASYDHRVLTGAQVVTTLRELSKPKK